jgi:hypothetical protein
VSFLNGALALGALTALVPLVIHLFNRSRFKVIKWGASHLLESVLRKNRKQIQLEQWIILIIRCSIPILLALTLARMVVMNWNSFLFFLLLPLAALLFLIIVAFTKRTRLLWGLLCLACLIVTGFGALGFLPDWGKDHKLSTASGDVPASTVILLDDSLSMNAMDSFSKAQDFITGFLANMHQQSETSILQLGGITAPIFDKPTSDPNALELRAENLHAEGDRASLLSGLDQALSITAEGKNLKREIILLSDFRKLDWQDWDNTAVDAFRERLSSTPNSPELTWVDFGREASKNLSIVKVAVSSQTVGLGHPVRIRATIRNFSEEKFDGSLQVKLFADQNETAIDEAVASVGPFASTQVAFTHHFKTPGSKVLHTEIQIADDLPQDNRRSAALNVIEQIKVLLVDGDPSDEWLRGDTDFLKLALTPFEESRENKSKDELPASGEMKDLIQATSLTIDEFQQLNSFSEYSLIVLANLQNLKTEKVKELEIFTANGGGVLICSGNQMEIDWYNNIWGVNGSDFLPMPIKKAQGNLQNELSYSKISSSFFEHPALSMFNDPRNGSLAGAQIKKWLVMDESKIRNDPTVTVLARLTNGHPILAEKKFGKGAVMLWGTSIDTDWTNLPARPGFLPFTQQIASYLSEKVLPPRTVNAGLPITHYLNENDKDTEYALALPNGSSRMLIPRKRKDRLILEFTETRIPGTYELSNPEKVVAKFVVLPSLSESILEKVTEEKIASAATSLADDVIRIDGRQGEGWDSYLTIDSRRKFGRETWQILLTIVLGLVFVEIILLRRFGRGAQ